MENAIFSTVLFDSNTLGTHKGKLATKIVLITTFAAGVLLYVFHAPKQVIKKKL